MIVQTTEDELLHLMNAVQGSDSACTLQEVMTAENEVPICFEFADDTWDGTFMNGLQPNSSEACISSDEDECEQDAPEPPAKRMKTYKEAVECLEGVCVFLERRGHTVAATEVDILVNKVTKFQCSQMCCSVQSSITSYFNHTETHSRYLM